MKNLNTQSTEIIDIDTLKMRPIKSGLNSWRVKTV